MIRGYAPLLEPLGLTYAQYLVLVVLNETDAVSVRQLGERLSLDSATLTPLLKRLEAQGAIERRRDSEDERVVRVSLTKQGHALRAKCREFPLQAVESVFRPAPQRYPAAPRWRSPPAAAR